MDQEYSRRRFLKVAGGGIAGATVLTTALHSRLAQALAPPDAVAVPRDARLVGPTQPSESGWQLAEPRLSTPWTRDVSPANDHFDYPRPQMTRRNWLNLNGVWQFDAASGGESAPSGRDLGERILVPFPVESAISGINRHEAHMFYRRRFVVPPNWNVAGQDNEQGDGQRLLLHFDAVDYETRVYINGTEVGRHTGGYNRFSFDITDALTGATDGQTLAEQELVVEVIDPTDNGGQPLGKQRLAPLDEARGIFYTPCSGIWKTVWLEPVPAAHITRIDAVPDLDTSTLRLTVHVDGASGQRVRATAFGDRFRIAGQVTGAANRELALTIANPHLWSPDDPYLYGLRVELLDDSAPGAGRGRGRAADLVDSYFGMRSIGLETIGGMPRMVLNGEFLFELGPLDQGYWPDGIYTAPTDEAMKSDLVVTKELGFNMVRKHIKVEPDRWYYYADKLGLLVWQDMPAMPTGQEPGPDDQATFYTEMHDMIDRHLSHPSIVVWVPLNEGWGVFDPATVAARVKQWDSSRIVDEMSGSNVCNCAGDDGDLLDLHNYVGPGPAPQPDDGRGSVVGEFGGLGLLPAASHLWSQENNHAYETEASQQELTDRYVDLLKRTRRLSERCGLSAAVYTQTTDVETEINGFLTYDRRVTKMDKAAVRRVNQAVIASSGKAVEPGEPPAGTAGLVGVGFWPFDQDQGRVAPDASGFGHNAALVNAPAWVAGYSGNALQFNGQNQYVDTGASILDTTENYSVAALVMLNDRNGFQTALSQAGEGTSEFFLQYSGADDRFAFSSTSVRALGRNAPQTGRWYHLVGVRDAYNSRLKLYVDGSLTDMVGYCPGEAAPANTLIGRATYGGNAVDFWGGLIDSVHVYDRALSTAEIKALYNQTVQG